jgi:hypothetical protein
VNERIQCDKFAGNLLPHAFRPDHKLFATIGREILQNYCGKPEEWDKLLEKIGCK